MVVDRESIRIAVSRDDVPGFCFLVHVAVHVAQADTAHTVRGIVVNLNPGGALSDASSKGKEAAEVEQQLSELGGLHSVRYKR